jgi:hypothetical protein
MLSCCVNAFLLQMSNWTFGAVPVGHGQVVDATAVQRQQQEVVAQRNKEIARCISKAFDAGRLGDKAASSRVYAVHGMVTAAHDPWRRPSGFDVRISNGRAEERMKVEQYLQRKMVYKGTQMTIADCLSKPDVDDVFSALQWCYREAMFSDVTSDDSARVTVSRIAGQVSVIIALQKHLMPQGDAEKTLHRKLAKVARSAEIPAKWLNVLLPLVQHDQSSIWYDCRRSVRKFALQLQKLLKPTCGALPSVAKVVEALAGSDKCTIEPAIKKVCSEDRELWHLVKVSLR